MALRFVGIDPETDTAQCPAVFVDEETGDLVFQGPRITDADTVAEIAGHSPVADHEAVVRLPARMREIVKEAINVSDGTAV